MWGYLRNHFTSVYFMSIYVTFVCKNEGGGLCISKCTRCCVNTPTPPLSLVPSAQLQQANYSRQSLLSPHSFFFFFLPSSPFVPLPTAAHTAYSQISYSQAPQRAPLHMRARESVKRGGRGFEVLLMGFAACFDGDSCPTSIWSPVELFL